ncbi:M55 family metallopeptidase [Microtetraspora fusca]|uniref:M55 family metallopeptidase n=1 Tax=Microtetraspora fusca TaxID=1997 RepID=A0ABW6UWV4_MICFU
MRVLISADMEGVTGVADPADVRPGEPEYERHRRQLTAEVNAAVRGVLARHPGATVTVTEAHAAFRNLLLPDLDPRARVLRGRPKTYGMLAGLERGADAVIFLGYHAKAGTAGAVLAHTVSGAVIADVRCQGRSLGEIGLNAALAAHLGTAPVLVTGDDLTVREAAQTIPGVHTVEVKRALGASAADSLHPVRACELIEDAVPAALDARAEVRPPRFTGPVELEIDVHRTATADHALLVPGMRRTGGTTLCYPAPDYPTAYRLVELVATLGLAAS